MRGRNKWLSGLHYAPICLTEAHRMQHKIFPLRKKKGGSLWYCVCMCVYIYPSDLTNCTLPASIVCNGNVNSCLAPLLRIEIKANERWIQKKRHCSSWWWEVALHDKKALYCCGKPNMLHTNNNLRKLCLIGHKHSGLIALFSDKHIDWKVEYKMPPSREECVLAWLFNSVWSARWLGQMLAN